MRLRESLLVLAGVLILFTVGCNEKTVQPSVETGEIIDKADSSIVISGKVTNDEDLEILLKGFVWNTKEDEAMSIYENDTVVCETRSGLFTATVKGLMPNTKYYIRAFICTSSGVAYGSVVSFTTLGVPSLTTFLVSEVTSTTAVAGGKIEITGEGFIEKGICWGTSINPEVTDNKCAAEGADSSFVVNLKNLTPGTLYYVRAYGINSSGAGYGGNVLLNTYTDEIVTDVDGNEYHSVVIDDMTWFSSNLRTTKYSDGTDIVFCPDSAIWVSSDSGAYCWYGNDGDSLGVIYGALYNWEAVSSNKLCPQGWHVSTEAEWAAVNTCIGYGNGGSLKLQDTASVYWASPNTGATNDYLFSAIPGGYRDSFAAFYSLGNIAYWWTSTAVNEGYATAIEIGYNTSSISTGTNKKTAGLSIRCVKD